MKITLKKNSWHFRFYEYAMCSSTPPMSLCPYFWSLVGLVAILPILLIFKSIILICGAHDRVLNRIDEKRKEKNLAMTSEQLQKSYEKMVRKSNIMDTIGKIVASIGIAAILIIMITLMIIAASEMGWMKMLLTTVISITSLSVICGIVWFLLNFNFRRISNLSIVTMIRGMIISVYTKACPIIDWEDAIDHNIKK